MASQPRGCETWRPFIWDGCRHPPRATNPDGRAGNSPEGCPSRHPYSVLLPVGFAVPPLLPGARWALTPPFHPYPAGKSARLSWPGHHKGPIYWRGGLLSVALSLGFPPPAINRHRVSVEPGLSSRTAFRHLSARPPSRLAGRI